MLGTLGVMMAEGTALEDLYVVLEPFPHNSEFTSTGCCRMLSLWTQATARKIPSPTGLNRKHNAERNCLNRHQQVP